MSTLQSLTKWYFTKKALGNTVVVGVSEVVFCAQNTTSETPTTTVFPSAFFVKYHFVKLCKVDIYCFTLHNPNFTLSMTNFVTDIQLFSKTPLSELKLNEILKE